jgi:hypothetical protein
MRFLTRLLAFTANTQTSAMSGSGEYVEVPKGQYMQTIETRLRESITALGPSSPTEKEGLDATVKLINDSMTTPGRVYHALQHVFDISKEMRDPILMLSALFHDVIYYSIDQAFSKEQKEALEGVLLPEMQGLTLAASFDDPLQEMVVKLYGFEPGAPLPKSGTNEFLSAMIGVRVLSKWLSFPHLVQIAACIEATIPFRPIVDGKTPMDRLYDRLSLVCTDQSEEWKVKTVQLAVVTANYDLGSFDSKDRDYFLDSSWKLLPEARASLLNEDCPLVEFLNELKDLEGRSKFLKSAVPIIFQSFRQVPTDLEMEEKRRQTHENLDIMCQYAQVRLLEVMVLVEFADVMCEVCETLPLRSCLRMHVPPAKEGPSDSLTSVEQEIRNWLVNGRRTSFSWDPAASELGAFLFDTLGPDGISQAVAIAKAQTSGNHELLKYLPNSVVWTVASKLGSVLPDRAERFLQVPEKLGILAQ